MDVEEVQALISQSPDKIGPEVARRRFVIIALMTHLDNVAPWYAINLFKYLEFDVS